MTKNRLRTWHRKELTRDCMINNRARTVCLTWWNRLCLTKVNQYFAWKRIELHRWSNWASECAKQDYTWIHKYEQNHSNESNQNSKWIQNYEWNKAMNLSRTMNRSRSMSGTRPMNGTKTMTGIGATVLVEPHRCCVPELWMWIDL